MASYRVLQYGNHQNSSFSTMGHEVDCTAFPLPCQSKSDLETSDEIDRKDPYRDIDYTSYHFQ